MQKWGLYEAIDAYTNIKLYDTYIYKTKVLQRISSSKHTPLVNHHQALAHKQLNELLITSKEQYLGVVCHDENHEMVIFVWDILRKYIMR